MSESTYREGGPPTDKVTSSNVPYNGKKNTRNGRGTFTPPHLRRGNGKSDVNTNNAENGGPSGKAPPKRNHPTQKSRGSKGEGGRNPSNANNKATRNRRGPKLKVFSTGDEDLDTGINFQQFHGECNALRYKVHKPRCDCSKILRLVQNEDHTNETLPGVFDDGKVDALVVVPDTKQKFMYLCRDTPLGVFEEDPRKAELKLRAEIFPTKSDDKITLPGEEGVHFETRVVVDESKFKLSCASCMLLSHEPNGFCLVSSSSSEIVDRVRDNSRSKRDQKESKGHPLHPDHAHFVATIPRSALWNLHRSRTRAQTGQAFDEIFGHLSAQDIDAIFDAERFVDGIEMGHHLVSLLALTGRSDDFWFILGYDDQKSLTLDLPGGKRHLGETSLEGAIRETEEESSLVWDASWVTNVLHSRKPSDGGNRYFVLHPTQSFLENFAKDQ